VTAGDGRGFVATSIARRRRRADDSLDEEERFRLTSSRVECALLALETRTVGVAPLRPLSART
jgi:hypothetical protein